MTCGIQHYNGVLWFQLYISAVQKYNGAVESRPEQTWNGSDMLGLYNLYIYNYILFGGTPTRLKNMSSSVGMIIPNIWEHEKNLPVCKSQPNSFIWENKNHVPNHQPDKERCPGWRTE